MKKFLYVIAVMLGLPIAALAQKSNVTYTITESSSTFIEPTPVIVTTPLIADVTIIGEKITYVEPDALKIFPINDFKQLPQLRGVVVARAIRAHNADLIIGVSFDMETTAQGELKVTVTGFPAKYTNFHNASYEEMRTVALAKMAVNDEEKNILEGEDPVIIKKQ